MSTRNICYAFFFVMIFANAQHEQSWQDMLFSKELTAKQLQSRTDSIITKFSDYKTKDSILERITHKYAIWLYKKNKIDTAIHIAKYSQQLKRRKKTDTVLIQHGLNNLGFFTYKNKQYDKSIKYYQQSIILDKKSKYGIKAYSEIAKCYREKGDYYKSKSYFELANSLFKKNNDHKSLITNAINASETYKKLGARSNNSQGIKNLLEADSLSKVLKSKARTIYNIKNHLGNLYNQNENIEKALQYYNEALIIAKKTKDSFDIAATNGNLGNLYNDIDPDIAIKYQKTALNFTTQKSNRYALRYANIAYCQVLMKRYREGVNNYQKAIRLLNNDTISEYDYLLTSQIISKTPNKSNLLIVLTNLSQAYIKKHKITQDKSLLNESISAFRIADKLVDLIRIESQEFQSKLFWRKQSADLYGRAIEACFLAKDPERAFYFMEKNKALLLTEDILNNKRRQSLKLPQKLVQQETKLRKKIYLLEKEKKENSNADSDSISIVILTQKRRLEQLRDSIHNNFSEYTNIEIQSPITDLTSVQKDLDNETVLLEYNISEYTDYGSITDNGYTPIYRGSKYGKRNYSKGYLLCITKNDRYFIELQHADQLETDVKEFIRQASVPFRTKEDIISYHQIGSKVYDHLFPTEKIKEIIKHKIVRVIPDNYLNYVPFEALVTSVSGTKLGYLLEDCEISYGYSNSFLRNSAKTNTKTDKISFLGVAPGNFEKYNLIPLDNNINEVTNINGLFSGRTLINSDASKEQFFNTLKDKNIIHLATHADAMDSISPWIAFSDDKLNLEELYLTKNQAELVVLSGCNTLVGKQETGEGVMSLARGFFHSGTKSVVSSLWNVDDRSTAYIMNEFYKNLKNRQTKSKALREAKLSYLKNSSLSESSPHFWATFVLLGGTDPLQTSYALSAYWLFLLFPVLFVSVITYRNYRKKGF